MRRTAHHAAGRAPAAVVTRVSVLFAAGLVLASCSGPDRPLTFGVSRSSIDLAFKEAELARPPVVRTRVVEIPADVEPIFEEAPVRPRPRSFRPPELCPEADPNQILIKEATIAMLLPPKEGTYTYLVGGTVKVTLPPPLPSVTAPMPQRVRLVVSNMKKDIPVMTLAGTASSTTPPSIWQWDETWGPVLGVTWKRTMLLRNDALHVLKLVRDAGGDEVRTFEGTTAAAAPLPPTVYQFGSPGQSQWRIRTVDRQRRMVGLFEGEVYSREFVDLCGSFEDSYSSRTASLIATLDGSYRMETNPEAPNRYVYATHMSPLPVREQVHFIETIQETVPATVEWKYASRLLSVDPDPLPS